MLNKTITCGIAMPISAIGDYTEDHWKEVKSILTDIFINLKDAKLNVKPVWEEDYVNIIQKSIVNNIYQNDIVIFDLSSLNPNVMFELGLRLAFDKPVVIIRDNQTKLPFDTTIIEALIYDRGLKYQSIEKLKNDILKRVLATLNEKNVNDSYSPFLGSFGTFYSASVSTEALDSSDKFFNLLINIQNDISLLRRSNSISSALLKIDPQYIEFLIEKAINEWCRNNNNVPINSNLLKNKDFLDWVETEINSSRFFDSIDEFREVVNILLMRFTEGA